MKFALMLLILTMAVLSECKKNKMPDENNVSNSEAVYSEQKRFGDLKLSFSAKILKKGLHDGISRESDSLLIAYEIENTGKKSFVVFNRGHIARVGGSKEVYVEPHSDGTIEISQKAFVQPQDKQCPLWLIPRIPVGSLLKAKQTLNEKAELELPPKLYTPYSECKSAPQMPTEIKQARFCVGIAEVLDRAKVKTLSDGTIHGRDGLGEQQLLCSKAIELK